MMLVLRGTSAVLLLVFQSGPRRLGPEFESLFYCRQGPPHPQQALSFPKCGGTWRRGCWIFEPTKVFLNVPNTYHVYWITGRGKKTSVNVGGCLITALQAVTLQQTRAKALGVFRKPLEEQRWCGIHKLKLSMEGNKVPLWIQCNSIILQQHQKQLVGALR